MSRRKEPHPRGPLSPRVILVIIALFSIAVIAYALRQQTQRIFAREGRADITLLNTALDSAYVGIQPKKTSTSTVNLSGHHVRCDQLELSRETSIFRANHRITRAVEKAGGRVAYGLDSSDERRRWRTVTLGISDGDSLIREIRLRKRIR